jgi:hypothetical protein
MRTTGRNPSAWEEEVHSAIGSVSWVISKLARPLSKVASSPPGKNVFRKAQPLVRVVARLPSAFASRRRCEFKRGTAAKRPKIPSDSRQRSSEAGTKGIPSARLLEAERAELSGLVLCVDGRTSFFLSAGRMAKVGNLPARSYERPHGNGNRIGGRVRYFSTRGLAAHRHLAGLG